MERCEYGCNSKGYYLYKNSWHPCPLHGPQTKLLDEGGILPNGSNYNDLMLVPEEYRGIEVDGLEDIIVNRSALNNCIPDSVNQLSKLMNDLLEIHMLNSNILSQSIYVYANTRILDILSFVYKLQKVSFENNIGVSPCITVNDLAGLNRLQNYYEISVKNEKDVAYISKLDRLAGQGADWYLRSGRDYTDYLTTSVCIVLDNTGTTEASLRILSGVIQDRARRGLPTFIFSTCFYDTQRENILCDGGKRNTLSSVTPYLLLGKNQEQIARNKNWLIQKPVRESSNVGKGYKIADYMSNDFD